jgi:hypothetical protein
MWIAVWNSHYYIMSMVHLFRRMLYQTYSCADFEKAVAALKKASIKFSVRERDINNRSGIFAGIDHTWNLTAGSRPKFLYEIFVPAKQMCKAQTAIDAELKIMDE